MNDIEYPESSFLLVEVLEATCTLEKLNGHVEVLRISEGLIRE